MYDRDQVVAVVALSLVLVFMAQQGGEVVADVIASEETPAAAGDAGRVLDVAASQVGTLEGRGGATPYHPVYGIANREPWCAVFAWWVFEQAGDGELIPKTAWTPAMAQFYRDRGAFDGTPQVGSLVFFNWPGDGVNRIQHVGIVTAVEGDAIQTIEGNTSPGAGGSQSNGDGVYQRRRPLNSSIVGYGHPAYA